MKRTDSINSSTTQKHGSVAKTGEPSSHLNSVNFSSSESVIGRLKRKPNNCILCEIVLPQLEEEIARLKNKIKKLNERET